MLRPTPKRILLFIAAVLLFSSTINAQSGSGKIVFAEDAGRLLLINADGTGQTILTEGGSVRDDSPVYSPDGSKIAFSRTIGFQTDIYVMNAGGTSVVALTTATPQLDFSVNTDPSWSPDGSKIVFSSNRSGQRKSEIWVMNADANGHYSFTNVQAGRTYFVRPIGANYVFSPQTRDFNALDGDKIADFVALSANHLLFTQATRTVAEGIGTLQVTVARGGNAAGVGPITVDYTTEDGTAKAGEGYTAVSGTLSFPEGTFQRTITIPITEDLLREGTEQLSIKLMNPTGEVDLASPSTTLISITDNEPVLVTEPNSDRAITVNAVSRVASPFSLTTQPNFSADIRTRISLFVEQFQFTPTFPTIVITAVDAQQNQFQIPLEAVIGFSRFPFAEFVVRLPENLSSGELFVTVTVNGSPSNVGRISVKP